MIFVECKPDLALVRSLTNIPRREIIHEFRGKGGICNQLKQQTHCRAMIDEDPSSIQPRYVKNAILEANLAEHGIKVLHDNANGNRMVVLSPRLEEWIIQAATETGVDLRQYNLPSDGTKLHAKINANLDRFESLLKELKHKGSGRLKALKSLLEEE